MYCMRRVIWGYEFCYQEPILLKFTSLPYNQTECNFPSLNGIIVTDYFDVTLKLN